MKALASFWRLLWGPWEFWPYTWVYPVIYLRYWVWVLRFGRLDWFSSVNPGMVYGGLFGYDKSDILKRLPQEWVPVFERIEGPLNPNEVEALLSRTGLSSPLIVKPEVGERGIGVQLVRTPEHLVSVLGKIDRPHLVQQFCTFEEEYGIFVIRHPVEERFRVESVCGKRFMEVVGDGVQTVKALLEVDARNARYIDRLDASELAIIPAFGVRHRCQPIGNHNRGTVFLDYRDRISPALVDRMNLLLKDFNGFHFGRFDIRAASWASLLEGRDFCIIELNGAASEPTHMYSPGFSFWEAQRTLNHYWSLMARIARHNGPAPVRPTAQVWADFKAYRRQIR
ncbi:hypothetical protein GC167_02085 [bacterium]|nr:hypothetical protein [bacterium]